MENGVGNVYSSNMVEKAMENEVHDSGVEDKVMFRSQESVYLEGNEVFEDSSAAQIAAVYPEVVIVSPDDEAEGSDCPVAVHKKTDSGVDFEKFEEAIELPVDVDNWEEQSTNMGDKREISVSVKPIDKVVVGDVDTGEGTREDDVEDETEDNMLVEVSKIKTADDKEIVEGRDGREVDIAAVLDKEIQEELREIDKTPSEIDEKRSNGVSDAVNLTGTPACGSSGDRPGTVEEIGIEEEQKNGDVPIVVPVDSDSSLQAEKGEEVKDVLGLLDNGHQDERSYRNEEDKGQLSGVTLYGKLGDEKNCGEVEQEISANLITLHKNDTGEETQGTASFGGEDQDEEGQELGRPLANSVSDNHLINGKPEASMEEREGTPEVSSSPIVVESDQKIEEQSSDVGVKRVEVFQPQTPPDKSIESSESATKEYETKGAKVEEAKQSTRGENGLGDIKPVPNASASSGKSDNSTPIPVRPAGLGRAASLFESAPRAVQQSRVNGTSSHMQSQIVEELTNGDEGNDETREKLQMIRVKFLRLAHRLGQTPHNVVVAQVLYRLGLAEQLRGRNGGRVPAFSFDRASAMAEQLEAAGQEPLDFSCTILVLGKTGVGKSATINSIFDEVKFGTDAFENGTKKVQDVVGTVQGIKVRVIDTPGLLPSWSDQRQNEKILLSVKQFMKRAPPNIVLYLDRLDMQTRDLGDMLLLRTITDIFGPSIWFNAIVVLTHAASAPPEGPNGTATSYDMFVTQRSHVVQQAIRQAAGDMRLMNPVSLVENHSACRKNRAGQRVLPNGQVWKPHLLLLSFASKILVEANTLLKLQDSPPGKPLATRSRAPPLPFLLSSLLQSRPQLKLPEEQFGDDDDMLDDDLDDSSGSDNESEYDELPPFKRLTKAQLGNLSKDQQKAYHAELEYREKLFMKKQLREEKRRRKMMKKMAASASELPSEYGDSVEEENGSAASVPVQMPDLALPASFDSDNPTHRYRYLDSPNQWLVRPVLDTHGWDHDIGYEGVNVERLFVVKQQIPLSFSGQITKDKKDANMQLEIASSVKHGEGKATSLGLDMQTLGKDIAYTLRSETKFSNSKNNKATAGLSVTMLGDALTAGVKIEDKLILDKRLRVVASGGAMMGRGDVAYGGSFEATWRDKDHPLGRWFSTLGLSVMDWHGDLAIGGNLQSQIPVGRSTNLIARANLNNRGSGQVSIRLNSSEQLQIVLIGLIPLLRKALGYPQVSQFGQ